MSQSRTCLNFRTSLNELKALKEEFYRAYHSDSIVTERGRQSVAEIKKRIEEELFALRQRIDSAEIEGFMSLRKQYESQVDLLRRAEILESEPGMKDGEVLFFIKGIDERKYYLPTYIEVVKKLMSKRELLETKADQGFTKLVLIPFGMGIRTLTAKLHRCLSRYKKDQPDTALSADGVLWTASDYLNGDRDGTIRYYPKRLAGSNSGGQTKQERLAVQRQTGETGCGWDLLLFQADDEGLGLRSIPLSGKGEMKGVKRPRKDIETGREPEEYLREILEGQTDKSSPYTGEVGMTPEAWIVACMDELEFTGKLLDKETRGNAVILSYLTGACLFGEGSIPLAGYVHITRQFSLSLGAGGGGREGARNAVLL